MNVISVIVRSVGFFVEELKVHLCVGNIGPPTTNNTTELNTPVAFLTLSTLPIAGQLVTRNQWMLNICYFLKGWRAEVPRSTKSQQAFYKNFVFEL